MIEHRLLDGHGSCCRVVIHNPRRCSPLAKCWSLGADMASQECAQQRGTYIPSLSTPTPTPPPIPTETPLPCDPACSRLLLLLMLRCSSTDVSVGSCRALLCHRGLETTLAQGSAEGGRRPPHPWLLVMGRRALAHRPLRAAFFYAQSCARLNTRAVVIGLSPSIPMCARSTQVWASPPERPRHVMLRNTTCSKMASSFVNDFPPLFRLAHAPLIPRSLLIPFVVSSSK